MNRAALFPLAFAFAGSLVAAQSPYQAAFTPEGDYANTFYVTPGGSHDLVGPMALHMLGGGDSVPGGGTYTKAGIGTALFYSQWTEGLGQDFQYDLLKGFEVFSAPLPPDVTSLSQLPAQVQAGLASWATTSKVPGPIAALEWARFLDLPLSVQLLSTVSQAGALEYAPGAPTYDLDRAFERGDLGPQPSTLAKRRSMCMWDVADRVDASDDDPFTGEPDSPGGVFTFASVSIADPALVEEVTGWPASKTFRAYVQRNLASAVDQFLAIASLPRYAGRVIAFAIDPEVHYPAHHSGFAGAPSQPLPRHPSYGGGFSDRVFYEDYNPASVLEFARYEQKRYGDATPLADSNGDGASFAGDFGADYLASGWPGLHPHAAVPATWDEIDPPRLYPADITSDRTAYWHEWINFRVHVLDGYVQDLVDAVVAGGAPPTRVFTHQVGAGSSTSFTRAERDRPPTSFFFNAEWLDDWITMEVSNGSLGTSLYGWGDIDCGGFLYDNIAARGGAWGVPEYNPIVVACPQGGCAQASVDKVYDTNARIIWPHAWDAATHPVFDHRQSWTLSGAWPQPPWTAVNMNYVAPYLHLPPGGATDGYIEYLGSIATSARYLAVAMALIHSSGPQNPQLLPLRAEFLKNGIWHTVQKNVLRSWTIDSRWFVLDMAVDPAWTGTVDGLRVHLTTPSNDLVKIDRVLLPIANDFTDALKNEMVAKRSFVRPVRPPTALALSVPASLRDLVVNDIGDGRLTVYGTDPVPAPPCAPSGPLGSLVDTFSDFGAAGNFEPVTVTCGGRALPGLRSPASTYLGLHKTGKLHRLTLPDEDDLHLVFRIGIEDGTPAGGDGVRFRVLLRGADESLTAVFDREWRAHDWSDTQLVSLDAWRNEEIDLAFEVHGISSALGDASAWSEPRVVRAFAVQTAVLGTGSVSPSPSAMLIDGESALFTATPAGGATFHHWEVTPGLSVADANSATTGVVAQAAGTLTAVFVQTQTFESKTVEDGRTLESAPGSGVGGSANSAAMDGLAIRVGDANDASYRSLLSFETSAIPAGATIVEASVELTVGGLAGFAGPIGSNVQLVLDVSSVPFGTTFDPITGVPTIHSSDYQAAGSSAQLGGSLPLDVNAATLTVPLDANGRANVYVGPAGAANRTQIKLYLLDGPTANHVSDVLGFFPGGVTPPSNSPHLVVKYY